MQFGVLCFEHFDFNIKVFKQGWDGDGADRVELVNEVGERMVVVDGLEIGGQLTKHFLSLPLVGLA